LENYWFKISAAPEKRNNICTKSSEDNYKVIDNTWYAHHDTNDWLMLIYDTFDLILL